MKVNFRGVNILTKQMGINTHWPASGLPNNPSQQSGEQALRPAIDTVSSENLPSSAMTPPRAKRSKPKNETKEKKTKIFTAHSTPKKLTNFTIPKKKPLSPIGQVDGQNNEEDIPKILTPKKLTPQTKVSPSEPKIGVKTDTPIEDSDLEEGEVPDSDDEICIVNVSQKKEIKQRHHHRLRQRHHPPSRKRCAILSSSSDSSSSEVSPSSSLGCRSPSPIISTRTKVKTTHSLNSLYLEQSPYPGTKSSAAFQFRCLDTIMPTPEPSPKPPPAKFPKQYMEVFCQDKSVAENSDKSDVELQEKFTKRSPRKKSNLDKSEQDKSILEKSFQDKSVEEPEKCSSNDEIVDDSIHEKSITDEPTQAVMSDNEDDDDAIDLDIPTEDLFNSFQEEVDLPKTVQKDNLPAVIEDKIQDEDNSMSGGGQLSKKREYPEDIQKLFNYRLCFDCLEYGFCSTEGREFVHVLLPEYIFLYYKIIKTYPNKALPGMLRRSEKNRVHRLLSIYQSHKNYLIGFSKWYSLTLLNYALEDLATLSSDNKCYSLTTAKSLWLDLNALYPSETFSNDYRQGIVNINDMMAASERLCEIALVNCNQDSSLSAKLAWSVFNFALQRGLVLELEPLTNIWDILLEDRNLEYLPYVTNYIAEKPDIHISLNHLNKTLKLVMEQRKCEPVLLLSVMITTLMNIEPLHAVHLDRALLQDVVCCCQSSDSSELNEFTDRLKSFKLPNLCFLVTQRAFKDVSLENKIHGLIVKRKWSSLADMVLAIPLNKTFELYDFSLKLFEVITKEDNGGNLLDATFAKFANEVFKRNEKCLLPIHSKMLSQLAASIIIHLQHDHLRAMSTVVTCFQLNLEPWICATHFNPDAESEAITTRHQGFEVVKAGMEICMADPNFVYSAYDIMIRYQSSLVQITPQTMFELTKYD
jgi:hypothetical protein